MVRALTSHSCWDITGEWNCVSLRVWMVLPNFDSMVMDWVEDRICRAGQWMSISPNKSHSFLFVIVVLTIRSCVGFWFPRTMTRGFLPFLRTKMTVSQEPLFKLQQTELGSYRKVLKLRLMILPGGWRNLMIFPGLIVNYLKKGNDHLWRKLR